MKTNLIFFVVILFIWGCTKPVTLDLPDFIGQPVVNCFFTPEEPFSVHVSKTASQFDTLLLDVENACVEIFENEILLAELPSIGNGFYVDSGIFPQKGIVYNLKVNLEGYAELSASDSVPYDFSEFNFKGYDEFAWYAEEGTDFSGLTFEIDDKPGANYYEVLYRVEIFHYSTFWDTLTHYWKNGALDCFDPLVKEDATSNIFSDRYFDNQIYEIELMSRNIAFYSRKDSMNLIIQVLQGSQRFFDYKVALDKHRQAQYTDFFNPREPVIMYSNIENGYGVFAGYASKFYPVNIKE